MPEVVHTEELVRLARKAWPGDDVERVIPWLGRVINESGEVLMHINHKQAGPAAHAALLVLGGDLDLNEMQNKWEGKLAEVDRLKQLLITERVSLWHLGEGGQSAGELHSYLGLTREEYAAWVERCELPAGWPREKA